MLSLVLAYAAMDEAGRKRLGFFFFFFSVLLFIDHHHNPPRSTFLQHITLYSFLYTPS